MQSIAEDKGLKREIGVWGLTANIMNIMVGAGIFGLPAIVAGQLGAASIFAYLFCGVLITLVVLCFAEAGAKVKNTGGPYTYIETAFGNYAGFLAGVFTVIANMLASAAVVNLMLDILATLRPEFGQSWVRILVLSMLYLGLVLTNIIGVKQGMGLVKFTTVLKLTPLLLLVLIGWKDVTAGNLHIGSLPGFSALGQSSLTLFFAFLGCETGLVVGGEIKNPSRTLPRAVFIAIGSVVLLYILLQLVSQGILGAQLAVFKATPLAEAAKIVFGPAGYIMLIAGSAVSIFGNVSGDMLNTPRVLFALCRDRVIPIKKLAQIHPRFATPSVAILVYGLAVFIVAIMGNFEQLAAITTSAILLVYLGVALSVIQLRKKIRSEAGEFKIPGGNLVPVLSAGIILCFLSHLSSREIWATLVFIALLSLIFFLVQKAGKRDNG